MIVYLTGGIGAGKSTVLRMFADLGARVASADEIVRELYTRPSVQEQVASALGLSLPLDRAALADIVFTDAAARQQLEALVHPLVRAEVDLLRQREASSPVVCEIPLPPMPQPGDLVIAVSAPLELRLQRLVERGMDVNDARRRIALQPPAADYGKSAVTTIVNDGDVSALRETVTQVWRGLLHGSRTV